jgi:autotransporter-associated beta strand protein
VISGTGALSKIGAGTLLLTQINSYQGATTISNGVLSIDSDATPGDGNGTLNLSGGTLNATASRSPTTAPVANPINVTADSVITTTSTSTSSDVDLNLSNDSIGGAAGTLTFSNANGLAASVFAPRFSGSFNFNRPVVIANGGAIGSTRLNSFNSTGTTQTFNGVISGSGGYRRTASTIGTGGVTVFTADNAYTGLTEVNRGTLLVNGSLAAESPVTVGGTSQNGILGGTGTIYGPVTVLNSGTLAPGTSIGQLTISNTLTLQSGSTTVIELNKTLGTNDFVRGLSNVAYAGTLVVTNLSGTLASSNTFKLFEAGAYTGAFDLFDLPPLANGLTWDTTGLTSDGTIKVIGTAIAQPHIDSVSLSSGNLVLSGTGGTAGADYHVLASTNVALPLAQWSPIQTNQFTVGGNFAFTNSIDSNTPKLFFILQVP